MITFMAVLLSVMCYFYPWRYDALYLSVIWFFAGAEIQAKVL